MRVLGISAFYHDSAAALVDGGRIVAAAQEERFTRRKNDAEYPQHAIAYCLRQAGITAAQVDRVVFYDKPLLKFERLLETYVAVAPLGFRSFAMALPLWVKEKLFQKDRLRRRLKAIAPETDWNRRLLFAEHHQSHAASAFYPSPFRDAVTLTMDGVGEWATTSVGIGHDRALDLVKEIHFPHSLGLFYSAFTYYTGFKVNEGEYKMMGLAPYGRPKYAGVIMDHLIDLKDDGSFRLNMDYFDYCGGLKMTNGRFDALFGGPPRPPDAPLTQRYLDLAASAQAVLEEAVLRLTRALRAETGIPYLCLAGGVALNCVANGKIRRDGHFKDIWIQPAAGDAGGALGAALLASHRLLGEPRHTMAPPEREARAATGSAGRDGMNGSLLGPEFTTDEICRILDAAGARYALLSDDALIEATVAAIADGKAVGWFQGRMEFGPRALGSRSILADARSPTIQRTLNLQVKSRESFRPFAPSVLREDVADWFEPDGDSPYMLLVAGVKDGHRRPPPEDGPDRPDGVARVHEIRSTIPAVTHVDYSARVQTVRRETNPRYYALIAAFKARTGCPVIVNTSFNVNGEPLVCTPQDAWRCFMGTEIECLAIGNCFLRKEEQTAAVAAKIANRERRFERD